MGDHDPIVAHQDLLALAIRLIPPGEGDSAVETSRIVALSIISAALLDIAESLRRLSARPSGES